MFTFTLVIFAEPSANTWQSNRLRANGTEATAVNNTTEKERAEEAIGTHQQKKTKKSALSKSNQYDRSGFYSAQIGNLCFFTHEPSSTCSHLELVKHFNCYVDAGGRAVGV